MDFWCNLCGRHYENKVLAECRGDCSLLTEEETQEIEHGFKCTESTIFLTISKKHKKSLQNQGYIVHDSVKVSG